jgi:N6-L-threonylcarbamoyladenine synthase/protein kinase Bud32
MIPREAAEHHIGRGVEIIKSALEGSGLKIGDIGLVAFAQGPGLPPCLRIGAAVARYLSLEFGVPLVGVNHPVGHLEIGRLTAGSKDPVFLYLSGGNTQIISYAEGFYRIFGETVDVPIGNALDVVARELKLKSPGGPEIERLARDGKYVELPYGVKGMDISFSGIVTEAKRKLKDGVSAEDISRSIQETCFAMLTEVTERALAHTGKDEVLLVGGVAANKRLQNMLTTMCDERGAKLYVVEMKYAGDNGVMIAWAGLLSHTAGEKTSIERSGIKQKWRTDDAEITWM